MATRQRISYVPFEAMTADMQAEMERCARVGTPRPESSAVRAHVPAAFWAFANSWRDLFHRQAAVRPGQPHLVPLRRREGRRDRLLASRPPTWSRCPPTARTAKGA